MSGGRSSGGSQAGTSDTSKFTVRRLRSAFFLWRTSVRGSDLLVAGIFIALSLGLGAYVFARTRATAHLAFAQRAQKLQLQVSEKLATAIENLYTIQSFLEASDRVTRSGFRLLALPMLVRNKEVYAFEWLPVVREAERAFYEAEARAAHLPDYRFWEDGEGQPREAGRRGLYVPVHYMEPPNSKALGFDITSSQERWDTAGKARDEGEFVASPPFILVQDEGRHGATPVVAAYAPVYREGDPGSKQARLESIKGFAVAIFRVGPLVDKAASDVDASGLGLSLRDTANPKLALADRPPNVAQVARRAGFEIRFPVKFATREWSLDVFALPDAFLPSKRGALEVALFGTLASIIGLVTLTSLRTHLAPAPPGGKGRAVPPDRAPRQGRHGRRLGGAPCAPAAADGGQAARARHRGRASTSTPAAL